MRTATLTLLIVLGLAPASRAEDARCGDLPTQSAMNECSQAAYQRTDIELNRTYGRLMTRVQNDPELRQSLIAAEKAWLAFRNAECDFTARGTIGGSIHPLIVDTCLDAMTKSRIGELKGYLSCQNGDLSCPVPPP